jgi:hypothetical protein
MAVSNQLVRYAIFVLALCTGLSAQTEALSRPVLEYPITGEASEWQSQATKERVCVKYRTQSGWSQGYNVEGTIIRGSELNKRTSSFDFNSLSTYVVIFWRDGQASVLELQYFFGSISAIPIQATDQRGRTWEVSKTSLCY